MVSNLSGVACCTLVLMLKVKATQASRSPDQDPRAREACVKTRKGEWFECRARS
jgi:hypothetical protein